MSTLDSLLVDAIEKNDIPTVSSLIEKGVNVNNSLSPLSCAAKRGRVEIMTMLLDAGADIDAGSHTQNTPCFAAIAYGRSDALKLLLDRGARIDASFLKAAMQFRQFRREAILLLLLDAGAPLDDVTDDLIYIAASSVALLNRLLARNVNVSALKNRHGDTLCHQVILDPLARSASTSMS
jgi:ankyrin repeat protein